MSFSRNPFRSITDSVKEMDHMSGQVELGGQPVELRIQRTAKSCCAGDQGNRNERGDQSILDGRCAGLFFDKLGK